MNLNDILSLFCLGLSIIGYQIWGWSPFTIYWLIISVIYLFNNIKIYKK